MPASISPRRVLLLALTVLCILPASASAQATRTWVSGVGDDANPCSRTAPCKTWAGAISKTAAGGEMNALDPGSFGSVTITKAMTIDGEGIVASTVASGAGNNGINVNASVNDRVVIRGLSINGAGTGANGIRIFQARSVTVENTKIFGFTGNGISFEAALPSTRLDVEDSRIKNNGGDAVFARGKSSLTNVRMVGNGCGVVAASFGPSGAPAANCGAATTGASSPVTVKVIRGRLDDNDNTGVMAVGTDGKAKLARNEITGNAYGLQVLAGGTIQSFGDNWIFGNDVSNGTPTSTIATS